MRVDESCQTLACIKRMMVPARMILSHTLKFTTQETIHRSRIQDWGLTFASTPQQVLCLGVSASQYTQTKNHNLPETTTSQFQVRRYSSCAALSDDSHSIVRRKFTGDGDSDLVVESWISLHLHHRVSNEDISPWYTSECSSLTDTTSFPTGACSCHIHLMKYSTEITTYQQDALTSL